MKAIGIPMKAADGRPTAQMKVCEWRKTNPSGRKADCHKETGLAHILLGEYNKE